jgi:hypothetical protein
VKNYNDINLAKVAEKFLIGDGPDIVIISERNDNLTEDQHDQSKDDKCVLSFVKNNFDINFLFYCFHDMGADFSQKKYIDSMINPAFSKHSSKQSLDKKHRNIVLSGVRPTQASLICDKFGLTSFFAKNDSGLWTSYVKTSQEMNGELPMSTYIKPYATLIVDQFAYCYQPQHEKDTVYFSLIHQNSRSSML